MSAALLLLALAAPPELARDRVYDPLDAVDQEAMAKRLLLHVALLEVEVDESDDILVGENPRTGYGAVLSEQRIVCLSHIVTKAKRVTVRGPKGHLRAKVLYADHDTRVAMLAPEGKLTSIGLWPVTGWVPPKEREVDMPVFALVSTLELAGVSQGVLTNNASLREYEGHPRIDLRLDRGMPVFDHRARLLGFSRVVAWDHDRFMIVPPEKLRKTKTPTAASARPPRQKKASRPWWAK